MKRILYLLITLVFLLIACVPAWPPVQQPRTQTDVSKTTHKSH